jgi:hypothetical protein
MLTQCYCIPTGNTHRYQQGVIVMNSQIPTLSFVGDINGMLAGQLKGSVNLNPFDASAGVSQHGLVIDGSAEPLADQGTFTNVLDSGALLAICNPTTEQTALLGRITGQTPSSNVAMVSFKKTSSLRGYKCVVVPYATVTARTTSDSDAPQVTKSTPPPNVGRALAKAALDAAQVGVAPAGLVPPQLVYCGYRNTQIAGTWDLGYPNFNGGIWDDNTAKDTDQSLDYSILVEWFVYWVNGGTNSSFSPYYMVIQRQTGPFTIGNPTANNTNSRGWFTIDWKLAANSVQINNVTNPSGMELVGYAPKSASNNTQLPVQLQVSVPVWGQTQSGTGPTQFVATVEDSLDYPNWGILDQTSGASTQWEGYQTEGWNPLQNPTWQQLYTNDSSGGVVTMSDQSFGSIDFEALTCWTFNSPLFTPPSQGQNPDDPWYLPTPSLPVTFWYGIGQDVAFLHNWAGCSGHYSGEHHHIWIASMALVYGTALDLSTVVQDQTVTP